jgi:hypothetical protein
MPPDLTYTPAAGHHWLTPLYDFGVAALTREKRWRSALIAQVRPRSGDVIVDVGCGTGSMLARLGKAAPSSRLIGGPRDIGACPQKVRGLWPLSRTAPRLCPASGRSTEGNTTDQSRVEPRVPPGADGREGGRARRDARRPEGRRRSSHCRLRVTAHATHARPLQGDGRENTEPNARGVLRDLMRAAGFRNAEETLVIPTPSGSISLYRGSRIS